MKTYVVGCAAAAVGLLVVSLVSLPAAQNGAPSGNAPCFGCSVDGKTTPRTADGHPDLSGFWGGGNQGDAGHISARASDGSVLFDFGGKNVNESAPLGANGERLPDEEESGFGGAAYRNQSEPPYKPEYAAKVKEMVDNEQYGASLAEDPQFDCKPLGIPRGAFGQMQIVQTPQVIAVILEAGQNMVHRLIYMDGRPHPKDPDPPTTYMGDSIGHWDGDTLVIDTAQLSDETWLGGGMGGPKYALMHSDQEHVIERWTRVGDTLTDELTVEDPVVLAKPWIVTPKRIQHGHGGPDDYVSEYPCITNDKGHFVRPTKDDKFICNYCTKATRTPGTGLAPVQPVKPVGQP
jgi:hypothetical protein